MGDDCYRASHLHTLSVFDKIEGFFISIKLSLSTRIPANMTEYHGDWFSCITIQYHISSYLSMKPFITIPRGRGESKNFTHGLSNNGPYEDSHYQFLEGLRLRLRLETLDVEEVRRGHFVQQTESRAGHVGTQAAAL